MIKILYMDIGITFVECVFCSLVSAVLSDFNRVW